MRDLAWILLAIVACTKAPSEPALPLEYGDDALKLALDGHEERAWIVAHAAAEQDPADETARYVLASLALKHGNLDEAQAQAMKLVELRPASPEGVVLAALAKRRRTHPEETWLDSYLEAYRAAGKPACADECLSEGWMRMPEADPTGTSRSGDPAVKLWHAAGDLASLRAVLETHDISSRPELVLLAAAPLLSQDYGEHTSRARTLGAELLRSITGREDVPGSLGVWAQLALTDPDAPFTLAELERLEVKASTGFHPHLRALYARAKADGTGRNARRVAFAATIKMLPDPQVLLSRAEATVAAPREVRMMTAQLLLSVAGDFAHGRSLLERAFAAALARRARALDEELTCRWEASVSLPDVTSLMAAPEALRLVPSLLTELVDQLTDAVAADEIGLLKRLSAL